MPLTAVLLLSASPLEMGLLGVDVRILAVPAAQTVAGVAGVAGPAFAERYRWSSRP
jgi:hypothetical protein